MNENALRALAEIGIEHKGVPKHVREVEMKSFDLIVTLCDSAVAECPAWVKDGAHVHLGVPDPTNTRSRGCAGLDEYSQARDNIQRRVLRLCETWSGIDSDIAKGIGRYI